MQQMVCGRQDKVRTAHMVYTATLRIPTRVVSLLFQRWNWCWKVWFGVWIQGGDRCWLGKYSLKGQE